MRRQSSTTEYKQDEILTSSPREKKRMNTSDFDLRTDYTPSVGNTLIT